MRLLCTLAIILLALSGSAQNNVGIKSDGSQPDSSAKLDIQSTTQGVLLPRMTTSQRNSMPKKTAGLLVYDTDKQTLYMYNGQTWTPLAAVTNNELQAFGTSAVPGSQFESFGCSVSISGNWAAIGAYGYDLPGKPDCGGVYLFQRVNGVWQQKQIITAADAFSGDRFGYSVSIDGNQLITGAQLANTPSKSWAGSAYIFENSGGVWTQKAKFEAGDADNNDFFGTSVSIKGNFAVVGVPNDDGAGADEGSVYLYKHNPGPPDAWVFDRKILGTLPAANDNYGKSVAITADYLVIGCPGRSSSTGYIAIRRFSDNWLSELTFMHPNNQPGAQFGYSVAINSFTIVAGAPGETVNSLANRGRVYSYYNFGFWQYNGDITLPSSVAGERFGSSVSFANGYLIAGSPEKTINGNTYQGETHLIKQTSLLPATPTWEYKRKIGLANAEANDYWGKSVAIDGYNIITGSDQAQNYRGKVIFMNIEE